jgi:hypothetical protein
MQEVVWTETIVQGPKTFDGRLARPRAVQDFYRDIAVLALGNRSSPVSPWSEMP